MGKGKDKKKNNIKPNVFKVSVNKRHKKTKEKAFNRGLNKHTIKQKIEELDKEFAQILSDPTPKNSVKQKLYLPIRLPIKHYVTKEEIEKTSEEMAKMNISDDSHVKCEVDSQVKYEVDSQVKFEVDSRVK